MVAYDKSHSALLSCMPAESCTQWWQARDGADGKPTISTSSNCAVKTTLYAHGKQGTEVELVTLSNGSHDWPGGYGRQGLESSSGFEAAQALWDSFAAHPRRR